MDPAECARRVGQSIEVLFRRYAKFLDGLREQANRLIEQSTGNRPDPVLGETGLVICRRRIPRLVDCSERMCWPAQGYGEVGRCGERSTSRVISLGAKTRNGGPQKPVPRLV
ncbi:hypothetical protein SGFS_009420 [Streptomyces graminofaciens]|uniref:Transposase n=1 Tax=Streptomyces graminofaciens TaxID=68212 RepID=A0ABN5V8P7_9ACTN|nr:hypothetical protein SGFS_009420 [Streptomyces graminofaciens]